jgi:uncharacterized protein (TIGR02118 family)
MAEHVVDAAVDGRGGVLFAWLNDGDDIPRLPDGAVAWEVEERVQWSNAAAAPGVKRVSFISRRPSLTRAEFAAYWAERHAPLARAHHPAVRRYVQNVVIDCIAGDAPATAVDGIAELSFDSVDDMEARLYDSDAGREVIADDVARFIDLAAGTRMLVREGR